MIMSLTVMVRLLQVFDSFELHQEDAPAGSIPPASWKHLGGRASIEKVWLLSAVTTYSKVRFHLLIVADNASVLDVLFCLCLS